MLKSAPSSRAVERSGPKIVGRGLLCGLRLASCCGDVSRLVSVRMSSGWSGRGFRVYGHVRSPPHRGVRLLEVGNVFNGLVDDGVGRRVSSVIVRDAGVGFHLSDVCGVSFAVSSAK